MHSAPRDDLALSERLRELRANQTGAETRLWHLLRGRALGGWKFRRQAPLYGFVVDFVCPAARLVIELDGAAHDHESAGAEDAARDEVLAGKGYRVLRFENREVFVHGDGVLERILGELERDGAARP